RFHAGIVRRDDNCPHHAHDSAVWLRRGAGERRSFADLCCDASAANAVATSVPENRLAEQRGGEAPNSANQGGARAIVTLSARRLSWRVRRLIQRAAVSKYVLHGVIAFLAGIFQNLVAGIARQRHRILPWLGVFVRIGDGALVPNFVLAPSPEFLHHAERRAL